MLGQPEANSIVGRCKLCSLERIFPARLDDMDRSNDYMDLTRGGGMRTGPSWSERIAS